MKKVLLILAVLASVLLCACGAKTLPAEDESKPVQDAGDVQPGTGDTADTPDGGQTIDLPILDQVDKTVQVGTAGSSMTAVQGAVQLLDWGVGTGLGADEIKAAAEQWLAAKDETARSEMLEKLANVDSMYQKLLQPGAESLLESAGCADAAYPWSDGPVDSIEAIMDAAGLR